MYKRQVIPIPEAEELFLNEIKFFSVITISDEVLPSPTTENTTEFLILISGEKVYKTWECPQSTLEKETKSNFQKENIVIP